MRIVLLTLSAVLLLAGSANAATVSVAGGVLTYQGANGFNHGVNVTQSAANQIDVHGFDLDVVTAGAGCVADTPDPGTVRCTGVTSLVLNGADRHDSWTLSSITLPLTENGNGGDDTLSGTGGNDVLNGGSGNDFLDSGDGDDTMNGGAGSDAFVCDSGKDHVDAGAGDDSINCSGSADSPTQAADNAKVIDGGPGNDYIQPGDENDTINAGPGDDNVSDNGGLDTVDLGPGDDYFQAAEDGLPDTFSGGTGRDILSYSNYDDDVTASLADGAKTGDAGENNTTSGFEWLYGGDGNDTLTGTAASNEIFGNGGDDTLNGLGGGDAMNGGAGDDVVNGGDGDDQMGGGNGDDQLNGDAGNDYFLYDDGSDTWRGGDGNDTAAYGTGSSIARGFSEQQPLTWSLNGLADDGTDGEGDNIDADGSVENVLGGYENDTITGNTGVNVLGGGPGNDTINAQDGTLLVDTISCGPGADYLTVDQFDSFNNAGDGRCETVNSPAITLTQPTITASTTPAKRRFKPFTFTTTGTLNTGPVPEAAACPRGMKVRVWFKAGKRTVDSKRVEVGADCDFVAETTFTSAELAGHHKLTVLVASPANRYLKPGFAKEMSVSIA